MGKIPDDAIHWDSGDWIEWHRSTEEASDMRCISPSDDGTARLTALLVNLLRAARIHFMITSRHLPVYDAIARTHGALHFGLPLLPNGHPDSSVQIVHLPPHGPTNRVRVDLAQPCQQILVVRIKDNFTIEARMIARNRLPDSTDTPFDIGWSDLPQML